MDSQYDMTTLDDEHRMNVFVVVGDLDAVGISIHDDSNITEIRETISQKLNVGVEDQDTLTCVNNNGEVCDVELSKEDQDSNKKLTEYDPPIVKGAVFNLEVKDSFDISKIGSSKQGKQSAPRSEAPKRPNDMEMKPTSTQGEKERKKRGKRQGKTFHEQQQEAQRQQRQQMNQQRRQQQQQPQQQGGQARFQPNNEQLEVFHKIQKHSKTHCRLLFVLMEIQLILLISRWGGLDMVLYLIAILFALSGFRGCRKLHPLWILAFLLWLLLEILLICLYIIAALIETHESIYGSVAAYVALLSFELILNVTWAWYYFKFLRMVLNMGFDLRNWGETQMKKTVIFC